MKIIYLPFLFLSLFLVSCSEDDSITSPPISESDAELNTRTRSEHLSDFLDNISELQYNEIAEDIDELIQSKEVRRISSRLEKSATTSIRETKQWEDIWASNLEQMLYAVDEEINPNEEESDEDPLYAIETDFLRFTPDTEGNRAGILHVFLVRIYTAAYFSDLKGLSVDRVKVKKSTNGSFRVRLEFNAS